MKPWHDEENWIDPSDSVQVCHNCESEIKSGSFFIHGSQMLCRTCHTHEEDQKELKHLEARLSFYESGFVMLGPSQAEIKDLKARIAELKARL